MDFAGRTQIKETGIDIVNFD